jgi:hypothetical protein
MITYKISFIADGEEHVKGFTAVSAGQAFVKCLKKYPRAMLVEVRPEAWWDSLREELRFQRDKKRAREGREQLKEEK